MGTLSIALLLAGVAGAVGRPFRLPAWVVPVVAAAADVAAGAISAESARRALDPLSQPIAFLLAAVPLAVLLDRLGFFSTVATMLAGRGRGAGALWVLGALVTTVFNLDAGVVLLTPLYVGFARTSGRDPFAFAAQPVLLACLASSALPVSNLTNLIAQSETGAGTGAFLTHLGLPSLAACTVGWLCYRRVLPAAMMAPVSVPRPGAGAVDTARALRVGGAVVAAVLIGFTAGGVVGVEPWMVALGADVVLLAVLAPWPKRAGRPAAPVGRKAESLERQWVPWADVPVGTALVAASLGVLAAAAVGHIPVHQLIGGSSIASLARTAGVTAVAANVANNLPALLVTLPAVGSHPTPALWAVLIGVNMGPVLLVTASLASLLWLDALGRLGVKVRARDFSRIGLRIGLPAAAAGLGVELVLRASGLGG